MKFITHMKHELLKIHGIQFIRLNYPKDLNYLILCLIQRIFAFGTFLGHFVRYVTERSGNKFKIMHIFNKQLYRSEWQTIKQGAMFYVLMTALVIPSGICSQQDSSFDYQPTTMEIHNMFDLAPLLGEIDLTGELHTTEHGASEVAQQEEVQPRPNNDPPFHNIVLQASQTYDVDPALIRAIIMAESSYNPQAVSHRGAQGLMQLMPTTAKWLGVEDSFNPEANIDAGVRYFKKLLDRFNGDIRLALAAYNAGSRYVHKYNGVPPFKATRIYIQKVLEYHQHYSNEMAATELNAAAV